MLMQDAINVPVGSHSRLRIQLRTPSLRDLPVILGAGVAGIIVGEAIQPLLNVQNVLIGVGVALGFLVSMVQRIQYQG
jgi:predicted Zn-dependent protease